MIARLYARYSTDRQSELSIVDQFRVMRDYAIARSWPIGSEHQDEGISGAALGNRPGCKAALSALRTGEVLLIMDLFRLARSQDLAPMITRLRHRGIRVIGVQDSFDSEARHASMQAGLAGIMSEEFRANIAARTHSGLELRARTGLPTGGKAYENAAIVGELFQRFADGETLKAIVSDLNRRGIPSPGASWKQRASPRGKWLVSALHSLLQNERYVGRLIWNRSHWVKDPDTGKRIRHERPQSEWIVQPCDPLIDQATWDLVQARFRARPGKGGVRRFLLSGLLECAECGSKLVVMGGSQQRYICGAYHAGGIHACKNSTTFPRLPAEEEVLRYVVSDMLSPEAIGIGVKMMAEERKAAEAPAPAESEEIRALERMVREGVLSRETAAPALVEARKKVKPVPATSLPWPSPKAWREAVEGMRDILQGEDIRAAQEALKAVIGPIPVAQTGDARITGQAVFLATGTNGRWIGSGGALHSYRRDFKLPTSTKRPR